LDQTHQRRLQKLRIEAGPEVLRALESPSVIEVLLNPDGRLWTDSLGEGMTEIGRVLPLNAEALIGTVADSLASSRPVKRRSSRASFRWMAAGLRACSHQW